jgi:TPR repeat protein
MRLLRASLRTTFFGLGALSLLAGCNCLHLPHKPDPKAAKMAKARQEYDRLAAKANAGDAKAARDLAKWCYTHDTDSERLKHWLQVAAEHGDDDAAHLAEQVEDWR